MKMSVVKVYLLVVLVCPLVVFVCPFVCLLVILVCSLVASVCPLVVLVVLSLGLFITDPKEHWWDINNSNETVKIYCRPFIFYKEIRNTNDTNQDLAKYGKSSADSWKTNSFMSFVSTNFSKKEKSRWLKTVLTKVRNELKRLKTI